MLAPLHISIATASGEGARVRCMWRCYCHADAVASCHAGQSAAQRMDWSPWVQQGAQILMLAAARLLPCL